MLDDRGVLSYHKIKPGPDVILPPDAVLLRETIIDTIGVRFHLFSSLNTISIP